LVAIASKGGKKETDRGPGIVRMVDDTTGRSYVIETLSDGKSRVLYYGDPEPKRMRKTLRFFETAKNMATKMAQSYFGALIASMGNDKQLMASIRYVTKM
jgi:hypothetical protein